MEWVLIMAMWSDNANVMQIEHYKMPSKEICETVARKYRAVFRFQHGDVGINAGCLQMPVKKDPS